MDKRKEFFIGTTGIIASLVSPPDVFQHGRPKIRVQAVVTHIHIFVTSCDEQVLFLAFTHP